MIKYVSLLVFVLYVSCGNMSWGDHQPLLESRHKTFEKGGGGYKPFRDPRELITESIREVAIRIVGGKFDQQFAIRKSGTRS